MEEEDTPPPVHIHLLCACMSPTGPSPRVGGVGRGTREWRSGGVGA